MKDRVSFIAAALACAVTSSLSAYLLPTYSYDDLFAKSELVVIARPVSSHDTGERKLDQDVSPPVPVAGVTTDCIALRVLKGHSRKRFKLHHFRDISLHRPNVVVVGSPTGITFHPSENKCYLMFLIRDSEDRFVPFGGQTDVEHISVQEIIGIADE